MGTGVNRSSGVVTARAGAGASGVSSFPSSSSSQFMPSAVVVWMTFSAAGVSVSAGSWATVFSVRRGRVIGTVTLPLVMGTVVLASVASHPASIVSARGSRITGPDPFSVMVSPVARVPCSMPPCSTRKAPSTGTLAAVPSACSRRPRRSTRRVITSADAGKTIIPAISAIEQSRIPIRVKRLMAWKASQIIEITRRRQKARGPKNRQFSFTE